MQKAWMEQGACGSLKADCHEIGRAVSVPPWEDQQHQLCQVPPEAPLAKSFAGL